MSCVASQHPRYRAVYVDMHTSNALNPSYDTLQEAQGRCEGDLAGAWTGDGQLQLTWEADAEPPDRWRMMMQSDLLRDAVSTGYEVVIVRSEADLRLQSSDGASL